MDQQLTSNDKEKLLTNSTQQRFSSQNLGRKFWRIFHPNFQMNVFFVII